MNTKPPLILVVDDIQTNTEMLKRRLQKCDFEVVTADGGIQALAMLADRAFDLVLLDIMMPDLSGIETLREIRTKKQWHNLPVIMVTAKDEGDSLPECLEIGANDYVCKPVNISTLTARIRSQLSSKWAMDVVKKTRDKLEEKVEERTRELQTSVANLKLSLIELDQAKLESFRAKTRLMDAIDSLGDGFALFDADHRLQHTNPMFYQLYELSPLDVPVGSSYEHFLHKVVEKGVITEAVGQETLWIAEQLGVIEKESEHFIANGRWLRIGQRKTTEGGLVGVYTDITEQKRTEEALRESSLRDYLTGLYNRRHFKNVLENEIVRWKRYETTLSLMVLDVDFFKHINDNFGHEAGDQILKIISNILTKSFRRTDTVARWGGDEFVILLPHTTLEFACLLAERIRNTVSKSPLTYREEKLNVTMSIGVTLMNEDICNGDELLVKADLALFRGKQSNRNRVCI
jgi:two-component system cell cycle response regulator